MTVADLLDQITATTAAVDAALLNPAYEGRDITALLRGLTATKGAAAAAGATSSEIDAAQDAGIA